MRPGSPARCSGSTAARGCEPVVREAHATRSSRTPRWITLLAAPVPPSDAERVEDRGLLDELGWIGGVEPQTERVAAGAPPGRMPVMPSMGRCGGGLHDGCRANSLRRGRRRQRRHPDDTDAAAKWFGVRRDVRGDVRIVELPRRILPAPDLICPTQGRQNQHGDQNGYTDHLKPSFCDGHRGHEERPELLAGGSACPLRTA